jgi:endonuclease/exonuclease/phosphatase family metal-dependent hydrolase
MPKRSDKSGQLLAALLAAFLKLPRRAQIALGAVVLVGGLVVWATGALRRQPEFGTPGESSGDADVSPLVNVPPPAAAFPAGSRDVVFCFWNVENLFDDIDDKRRQVDEPFDRWFVTDPEARQKKYDRLADVLLKMNGGNGPDVLACCEVESVRAAELLKDALNARLPRAAPPYTDVAMKNLDAGRHIAPCVISRIPTYPRYTKLVGSRMRILQVWLTLNGHDLLVVASHWTSQLSDKGDDPTKGRARYATTIHDLYAAELRRNPSLDFLVCGDFNDPPEADSVRHRLHLTGDARLVRPGGDPPRLFGLLSGKDPKEFGTHYYNRPLIYDHVGVSPGMFDTAGWGYDPDSVRVPTDGLIRAGSSGRRPWRFGTATDDARGRGYSDHFPVVVTLRVAP